MGHLLAGCFDEEKLLPRETIAALIYVRQVLIPAAAYLLADYY
jgi:hypothetical protein